jgi:hypothetical protein
MRGSGQKNNEGLVVAHRPSRHRRRTCLGESTSMSFPILHHVFSKSQFHGNAKVLLLAIADASNDCCGLCWLSVETLMSRVGVNERNTHKLLKQVSDPSPESGYQSELEIFPGHGPHGTNLYRLRGVSLPTLQAYKGGVFTHSQGCLWRHRVWVSLVTPKPHKYITQESQENLRAHAPTDEEVDWRRRYDEQLGR